MTRIKYPDDRVIKRQIKDIIERSKVFDEEIQISEYFECKPTARKNNILRISAAFLTVAAACAIIIAVNRYTGIDNTKNDAMPLNDGNVETEAEYSGEDILYREDDVKVNYMEYNNLAQFNDVKISYKCKYPEVDTNGKGNLVVNEYFVNIQNDRKNNSANRYINDILGSSAKAKIQTYERNQSIMGPVADLYETGKWLDISVDAGYTGTVKNDEVNVLSFSEICSSVARNSAVKEYEWIESYNVTMDANTGKKLTYKDIFADYDASMNAIAEYILSEVNNFKKNGTIKGEISSEYQSADRIKEKLENSNNFAFSANGLIISCNDFYTTTRNNSYSENVEENREGIEYSANVYNNFLIKYDLISLNGKYTKK